MSKSEDFQERAEECQRMAKAAPTDRERQTWLEMAETWLRMIEVRKVSLEDQTAEQKFDAELHGKDTGQTRSKSSN